MRNPAKIAALGFAVGFRVSLRRTRRLGAGLLILAPLLLAAGPWGPIPGGRIEGAPAAQVPKDWSFTDALSTIQVETKPDEPYSVTTWCITDGTTLYVPSRGAERKQWVNNTLADPRVRLRIGDEVYTMQATRVIDPAEQAKIVDRLRAKYRMARWSMDPDPAKSPDTWYFRMTPRQ